MIKGHNQRQERAVEPMSTHIIFYSWQADLPNNTNRGFIQNALETAAKKVATDLNVEPVIERDTQNVPGSPDIAKTIFAKITNSDVFVADVTLINPTQAERRTPNPNVLLELGYAMHAIGDDRIILVMNTAYGRIEELPFDLKMRRVIPYNINTNAIDKATERHRLAAILTDAISAAIKSIPARTPPPTSTDAAIEAVETEAPNRSLQIRRAMQDITTALERTQAPLFRNGGTDEQLINAINDTASTVREFTRLAEAIASTNDEEAARALVKNCNMIFEHYNNPRGFSGSFDRRDFDYWKFLGHELIVTVVALLLRDERYEIITTLLDETVTIKNPRTGNGSKAVTYDFASEHLASLEELRKLRRRMSLHADLLHERHGKASDGELTTDGPLSDLLPFDDFLAADYFLWLRGEISSTEESSDFYVWYPWSSVYLMDTPEFLHNAARATTADKLAKALNVPDVNALKERLAKRVGRLRRMWASGGWSQPIEQHDIDNIGAR